MYTVTLCLFHAQNSLEESKRDKDPEHLFHVKYAIIHVFACDEGRPSEIGAVTFSLEEGLDLEFLHLD